MSLLAFLLTLGSIFFNASAKAQTIYGLSGDRLVSFEANFPNVLFQSIQIAVVPGQNLVGMDFRPATGQLYGWAITQPLGRQIYMSLIA